MPTSLTDRRDGGERAPGVRGSPRAGWRIGLFLLAAICPVSASAEKVRITNVSDVSFGMISNLQSDSRMSQNICLYSNSSGGAYSISATGSGAGSSFELTNGSDSLSYEVEWSGKSGETVGTALAPNVALTGQTSTATQQFCNSGPATSASLTIILRGATLSQAREGSYSGSLTLLVAAE